MIIQKPLNNERQFFSMQSSAPTLHWHNMIDNKEQRNKEDDKKDENHYIQRVSLLVLCFHGY